MDILAAVAVVEPDDLECHSLSVAGRVIAACKLGYGLVLNVLEVLGLDLGQDC